MPAKVIGRKDRPKDPLHYIFVGLSDEEYAYFQAKRRQEAARQGRSLSRANYLRVALNNLWAEEDGDSGLLCELQETGRPRKHPRPTPIPSGSPSPRQDRAEGVS